MKSAPEGPLLHIGCGGERLEGWVNIDALSLPGVDVVADVTEGLDFQNATAVFAEHFLEHLSVTDALSFLLEAHRVLADGAWLRLSTPNLEWVWRTHDWRQVEAERRPVLAMTINRAFYGWGHQFLWNPPLLDEALAACGFSPIRACRYGESPIEALRGLERHEKYEDDPDLPHVIIREACKGQPQPERLGRLRAGLAETFTSQLVKSAVQMKYEALEVRTRSLEEQVASSEQHVAWMEQSRFWKARNLWFAIKAAFR